jgi:N-acetylmuramic acid 6-phosphate etherase
MQTEQQNPNTLELDKLSTLEAVQLMHQEDQQVMHAIQAALPQIAQAVEVIVAQLKQGGRLIYIGAGTSGRLGVLDAVECVPTFGVSSDLVQGILAGGMNAMFLSSEGAEDDRDLAVEDLQIIHFNAQDVLVGIAASGRTPYVLGALAYAEQLGAPSIGIACSAPSAVLEQADIAIPLITGAEVLTGSTRLKAGSAQKMALNMLSTLSMVQLGKVYGNLMVDVSVSNVKLLARGKRIIHSITGADDASVQDALTQANDEVKTAIVMLKRGVDANTARQLLKQAAGYLRRVIE